MIGVSDELVACGGVDLAEPGVLLREDGGNGTWDMGNSRNVSYSLLPFFLRSPERGRWPAISAWEAVPGPCMAPGKDDGFTNPGTEIYCAGPDRPTELA
jgi:hypothetical protein